MSESELKKYNYNGARSMVLMHESYMKSCYKTWLEAKKFNLTLPETDDEDYKSLDTLFSHILRAARNYMIWICKNLNLPDPEINKEPGPDKAEAEAEKYLIHLFDKWRLPLAVVPEEYFHDPTFKSNWGVQYCIDAMLEHAVMHPIRHEYQLRNLISEQFGNN